LLLKLKPLAGAWSSVAAIALRNSFYFQIKTGKILAAAIRSKLMFQCFIFATVFAHSQFLCQLLLQQNCPAPAISVVTLTENHVRVIILGTRGNQKLGRAGKNFRTSPKGQAELCGVLILAQI
jgi:hypothetical protein